MRARYVMLRGAVLALGAVLLVCNGPSFAQPPATVVDIENDPPRDTAAAAQQAKEVVGRKAASVTIAGPWSKYAFAVSLQAGDTLTPQAISAGMEALRDEITKTSAVSYLATFGDLYVLYISVEFLPRADSTDVDVRFIPRYVGVSLVKLGDNALPIPRWGPPPFQDVPRITKLLAPAASASYDREFGTALSGAIDSDVPLGSASKLNVTASARVSMDEPLHEASAGLGYRWGKEEGSLRAAGVSVAYDDDRLPLASGVKVSDGWSLSGQLTWKLEANTRLYLDAIARDSNERLAGDTVPENEQRARVMFESIPRSGGFLRAALWAGNSSAGGSADSTYRTTVLRAAWEKEFGVGPSQTIGLEISAGGGHIWGTAPAQNRFFGGNSAQKFLYDAAAAKTMLAMPQGPLLRSFGQGAAAIQTPDGIVGGTGFWHVNVDLTAPVAAWSSALIPDESAGIDDAEGNDLTLKQLMARQVDVTGPAFMQSALEARGVPAARARARTQEVMEEIQPAAHYIINDASLFAVKPLLLLDAAGLSAPEGSENWLAVGLGIQVTVVTAKFEAGYSRTIHGPTSGDRGAPFARLVFQRLF
jgi:hypothetical protein